MKFIKVFAIFISLSLLSVSCLDKVEETPPIVVPPQAEWVIQSGFGVSAPLNCVFFYNENNGWIGGNEGAFPRRHTAALPALPRVARKGQGARGPAQPPVWGPVGSVAASGRDNHSHQ